MPDLEDKRNLLTCVRLWVAVTVLVDFSEFVVVDRTLI